MTRCWNEFHPLAYAAAIGLTLGVSTTTIAQSPLVTGDLTIYYDFDNFTDIVMDGSGNGFNGKVQDATRNMLDQGFELVTTGVVSNDKSNPKRGAGAMRLQQSEIVGDNPVFLDLNGSVIKATAPAKVPSGAITVATWLNIPEIRTDIGNDYNWNASGSILQAAGSGPSFITHYQLETNGAIRLALRGELQAQNIVSSNGAPFTAHPFPNQPQIDDMGVEPQPYPLNEWFHVAYTYDKNANGGNGEFAMYFNGTKIRSGEPNGLTSGEPTGAIDLGAWDIRSPSDFYDGLAIGSVPDGVGARRLHGLVDEFYIFSRALSQSEIDKLALKAAPSPADFDLDGDVDGNDLARWKTNFGTGTTQAQGNVDGDNDVDGNDFLVWQRALSASGPIAAVPEPTSLSLLFLGMLASTNRRRRCDRRA
jgi:hypothetical protein